MTMAMLFLNQTNRRRLREIRVPRRTVPHYLTFVALPLVSRVEESTLLKGPQKRTTEVSATAGKRWRRTQNASTMPLLNRHLPNLLTTRKIFFLKCH